MSNESVLGLVLLTTSVAALGLGGCSSTTDSSSYDSGAANGTGATGSGAISAGGSGSTYVPPSCGQECQDYLVSWALNDTIWFLWNQKLAGRPVGPQDTSGACPLGGNVHITGFDAVADNGITTADVVFDLDACENSNEVYSLTFTGAVRLEGSFDTATEFAAVTFSSTDLEISGGLEYLDDPAIDESCAANITQEGMNDGFELTGRLCGRDFDESSLDPSGGGSSGAGGPSASGGSSSSSGGSSGNACMCLCPDGSDCTNSTEPNPCGVDADGIPNVCGCPVDCP